MRQPRGTGISSNLYSDPRECVANRILMSTTTNGSMAMGQTTARTTPPGEFVSQDDPAEMMRQSMIDLAETWAYLNEGFSVVQEYTDQFNELPVQPRTTSEDIQAISQEIDAHGEKMDKEVGSLPSLFEATIQQEVPALIRSASKSADWASLIRAEISKQVKEQVDVQITEHLPQSLQEQVNESRRQLEGVKISLENSQARMDNSFIGTGNLNDPLSPILMPDGKASRFYPPNTRSLFGYDLESAQALNKDYQLTETDNLHMNFQQFLRHIGTAVEVAVSPR